MKKLPRDYLALALDNVSSLSAISALAKAVAPSIGVFKIGLEQFTHFGPAVVEAIRKADRKIFLDLKFHDIPNTVGNAVESACVLGVDFLTIHTLGGSAMMRAAKEAADRARQRTGHAPKIIGVTLLTSIDQECLTSELSVKLTPADYVRHLATLAVQAGLDGIVCSAADLPVVKPLVPDALEIITPGIRPAGSAANDQKRNATPQDAVKNGATLLVLGRAVTEAQDPGKAAEEILAQVKN
jgi:orotidine-5'-phosphate decarboxylase